jgi:hypothetical protein
LLANPAVPTTNARNRSSLDAVMYCQLFSRSFWRYALSARPMPGTPASTSSEWTIFASSRLGSSSG